MKPSDHLEIVTFGFKNKYNIVSAESHFIVDCRTLPNPWSVRQLRQIDGTDKRILNYLVEQDKDEVDRLTSLAVEKYKSGTRHFAFGCVHGKHRSVAIATHFKNLINNI